MGSHHERGDDLSRAPQKRITSGQGDGEPVRQEEKTFSRKLELAKLASNHEDLRGSLRCLVSCCPSTAKIGHGHNVLLNEVVGSTTSTDFESFSVTLQSPWQITVLSLLNVMQKLPRTTWIGSWTLVPRMPCEATASSWLVLRAKYLT